MNLFGIPIIESNLVPAWKPRMKLSEKVQVTDEFRQEMDAWLLEFFGMEPLILAVQDGYIMHPATLQRLRLRLYPLRGGAA